MHVSLESMSYEAQIQKGTSLCPYRPRPYLFAPCDKGRFVIVYLNEESIQPKSLLLLYYIRLSNYHTMSLLRMSALCHVMYPGARVSCHNTL